MNETGVYEITVADRALSDLIDAVHDAAERPAQPSARGWASRHVVIRDFPDDPGVPNPVPDTNTAPASTTADSTRAPDSNAATDTDTEQARPDRRPVAEVIVEADGYVRVDVRFVMAGGAATARFDTGCGTTDTLDTMRPASFARYLMTATMAGLTARGVAAELIRHTATA